MRVIAADDYDGPQPAGRGAGDRPAPRQAGEPSGGADRRDATRHVPRPGGRSCRREPSNFARARFVTLDEYAGIGPADRRRLLLWLRTALLDRIGVGEDRVVAFDPAAEPVAEAARVEAAIAAHGGIDLAVVGLGPNGHLGFNEPGSAFDSRARRVTLTPESIRPTQPTGAPRPTCPARRSPSASARFAMPPG